MQVSYGDASFIAKALGDIALAKWMTQVSRESGLFWEGYIKHFQVIRALDLPRS
ncbi:MAG: hypothetical protein ACK587_14080 [Cyanobacteriota bacterium]